MRARTFTNAVMSETHNDSLIPYDEIVQEAKVLSVADGVVLEAISGYRSHDYQLGIFERSGDVVRLVAPPEGARAILLGGKPIGEPVIFYGPFAMTTEAEIIQAIEDFNAGTFGHLV